MAMLNYICVAYLLVIGAPQVFAANKGVQKQGDPVSGESKRTNRPHLLTPPARLGHPVGPEPPKMCEYVEIRGQVRVPGRRLYPPRAFANTEDGVVALLLPQGATGPRTPHSKQSLIVPMKKSDGYVFLTTLAMDHDGVNRAFLKSGWRVAHKSGDTGFQLIALATGEALGVVGTKAGGFQVEMMPLSERARTQFYLIQGRCWNSPIHLYNSASDTILGVVLESGTCRFVAKACPSNIHEQWPGGSALDFKTSKPYSSRDHLSFARYLATGPSDSDGDGHDAVECGGDDCDDDNPRRFPGNTEVCDLHGMDEDCNLDTFGTRDVDGDGHVDRGCFNRDPKSGEIVSVGTDCNDNNPAIVPGAIIYISDSEIEVCGSGRERLPATQRAVRQPNGTAVVQAR